MTPDPTTTINHLYSTGAWFCLAIVLAFFALRWASTHVAWLEEDHHAVYVSAALGGLTLLVVPAAQGTTPNMSMILSAVITVVALAANPKKPTPTPDAKTPQGGFVRFGLMAFIAVIAAGVLMLGCTGANRQKDLGLGLSTAIAISSDINRQNNKLIEAGITGSAHTVAEGDAKLAKYEAARDKVVKDVPIVLDALAVALQVNDDPTFNTAKAALATLLADVATMKGAQ